MKHIGIPGSVKKSGDDDALKRGVWGRDKEQTVTSQWDWAIEEAIIIINDYYCFHHHHHHHQHHHHHHHRHPQGSAKSDQSVRLCKKLSSLAAIVVVHKHLHHRCHSVIAIIFIMIITTIIIFTVTIKEWRQRWERVESRVRLPRMTSTSWTLCLAVSPGWWWGWQLVRRWWWWW